MSTNYDVRYGQCKYCSRYDGRHIGKSSMGWQFSFRAYDDIKSWKDWKTFLKKKNVKMFDECNKEMSFKDFCNLVEEKQKTEKLNHAYNDPESFLDAEGYSMSPYEFS
jgi:hypothetical protein